MSRESENMESSGLNDLAESSEIIQTVLNFREQLVAISLEKALSEDRSVEELEGLVEQFLMIDQQLRAFRENCDSTGTQMEQDNYLPLCVEMKKLYPDYSFEVIPIAIGATGIVMKKLSADLEKIGIDRVNKCIVLSQKAALFGSVKVVKSAMNY